MERSGIKYKIVIAYEGTAYSGWQVQPNADTIQKRIQEAIVIITGESKISVVGAGRTDAGVHALGQVAHFTSEKQLDERRFLSSMQALLPPDIRILSLEEVSKNFHAQRSAVRKTYRYHFFLRKIDDPFSRYFHWHIPFSLNIETMREACRAFIGKQDFSAFANEASQGAVAKNPIRTIFECKLIEDGPHLILHIEGDGFFYKMVRNIAGTLYDIGRGKLPAGCIESLLEKKDRRYSGLAAPSRALFLHAIDYRLESTVM